MFVCLFVPSNIRQFRVKGLTFCRSARRWLARKDVNISVTGVGILEFSFVRYDRIVKQAMVPGFRDTKVHPSLPLALPYHSLTGHCKESLALSCPLLPRVMPGNSACIMYYSCFIMCECTCARVQHVVLYNNIVLINWLYIILGLLVRSCSK